MQSTSVRWQRLLMTRPGCQQLLKQAYCYAELAVSSLAVVKTIAHTKGGMARLSRPWWLG